MRYLFSQGPGRCCRRDGEHETRGYVVLALGKMGAFGLNYSSDIDLMVFYEPEAAPEDTAPVQYFVRITRGLIKLLQERTADGYVFRVDLRLRARSRLDPDCACRSRQRSTITSAAVRTGNARR